MSKTGSYWAMFGTILWTSLILWIGYCFLSPLEQIYLPDYLRATKESVTPPFLHRNRPAPTYFLWAYGKDWATERDFETDPSRVQLLRWESSAKTYRQAVARQIYHGSLLRTFRIPLGLAALGGFALLVWGTGYDGKRNKALRNEGLQIRGRRLKQPNKLRLWGKTDDFKLIVEEYAGPKTEEQ